jgi:flagella basal body P-ring formation protein FlgA
MPAPAAGSQQFLRTREIMDMLAAHGEDAQQMRFAGSPQVSIRPFAVGDVAATAAAALPDPNELDGLAGRRAALAFGRVTETGPTQVVSAEADATSVQIHQLIADHLIAQTGRPEGWRVACPMPPRLAPLLAAAVEPPTCEGGNPPWTGRQRFMIAVNTANGAIKLPVLADVTLSQSVVVAIRPISRGSIITAADIAVQQMDSAQAASARRTPMESVGDLIGMETGRPIQVGEVIYSDQVKPPLLVKRGESITVIAEGGGIRVRTIALARQDGTHGELVQLESLETKERYDARVVGLRTAAVLSATQSAVDGSSPEAAARAAARGQLKRDVEAFRRLLPADAAPPAEQERAVAAFRKFLESDGRQNAQPR